MISAPLKSVVLRVRALLVVAAFVFVLTPFSARLWAADGPPILPLDQVKPGMMGTAYTIFAGDQIEPFEVEVIGVMPNLIGPKQSVILVQLHGAKVEHTGVVAGMSGSPVYVDGKLMGALSLKFGAFVKEPLAGVTPIEDILSLPIGDEATAPATSKTAKNAPQMPASATALPLPIAANTAARYPVPQGFASPVSGSLAGTYLEPIATPLTFSGFAPATLRQYADTWLPYGMVATAGGTGEAQPDDAQVVPGDMIAAILVSGDLSVNASCTVTAVVDNRVYACGHTLFDMGDSRMAMARGRTLATLASDQNSTKIVNVGGVIGSLTQDRVTAIMGRIGAPPAMIPVDLSVSTPAGDKKYHVEVISDPKMTPTLVGVVAFNGLTQNNVYGEGNTLRLRGTIDIARHSSVSLENMFAPTDAISPDSAVLAAAVQSTFARIFSNPYETAKIAHVSLQLDSVPDRRVATIENAWLDSSEAEPGQDLTVKVLLQPYRGAPVIRDIPISIPSQITRGATLRVQVSDSESLNRIPSQFAAQERLANLDQLITLLNREHGNNQIYVTLLKPTPTLLLDDKELPDAPLSAISVLDEKTLPGSSALLRESAAGQWSLPMDEVIAGSASVSVKIK